MQLFSSLKRRRPRLPEGVRIYAVGDVHGRADLLVDLLSQIDSHVAENPVSRSIEVFLGDYVDRGPNSRDVIDLLIKRGQSRETIFLKGNHETYFVDFLGNPHCLDVWRQYGGFETLLSYGLMPPMRSNLADRTELANTFASLLPDDHAQFLAGLMTSFTCGDFFFVHAGVQPGVPLDRQREEDLLWIRDDFLLSDEDFGKYIVHGHTPVRNPDIRSNRINIDTGAFATGRLTCIKIEGEDVQVLAQTTGCARKVAAHSCTNKDAPAGALLDTAENANVVENSPTIAPIAFEIVKDMGASREAAAAAAEDVPIASPAIDRPQRPLLAVQAADPKQLQAAESRHPPPGGLRAVVRTTLALSILVVVALVTIQVMGPRGEIGASSHGEDSILSGNSADEPLSGSKQTERADGKAPSTPRLILVQSAGRADGDIPLGVQVTGETAGLALEISGLPTGMTLSSGRPLGAGAWRIPAPDVGHVTIHPPQGFEGTTDLAVELRHADDTVVDRLSLHLDWQTPNVIAAKTETMVGRLVTADNAVIKMAATRHPTEQSAIHTGVVLRLDRERIDFLIGRSQELISEGDVEAARLLLRRAAEARDPRAALDLGATYDPIMLAILKVHGVAPDISAARGWYEKAKEFGSSEAQRRLELLTVQSN
jgi:Calcineurin-like phosphoesterase